MADMAPAMYYDTEALYIQSKTTTLERIQAIDDCITALLDEVLKSVGKSSKQEYMLNDGQTVIKTVYRDPNVVIAAATTLEKLKQFYVNQLNPRQVRCVSANNLILGRNGY